MKTISRKQILRGCGDLEIDPNSVVRIEIEPDEVRIVKKAVDGHGNPVHVTTTYPVDRRGAR